MKADVFSAFFCFLLFDLPFWAVAGYYIYITLKFRRTKEQYFYITELEEVQIYRRGNGYRIKGYLTGDPDHRILTSLDKIACKLQQEHSPGMTIKVHRISDTRVVISDEEYSTGAYIGVAIAVVFLMICLLPLSNMI